MFELVLTLYVKLYMSVDILPPSKLQKTNNPQDITQDLLMNKSVR